MSKIKQKKKAYLRWEHPDWDKILVLDLEDNPKTFLKNNEPPEKLQSKFVLLTEKQFNALEKF